MKKLLSLLLALLLVIPALADIPTYSPALQAKKLAIHAMYEKYGFTPETLGVFSILTAEEDGTYTLRFQSAFLPASRVGEYTAIVKGDDVTLIWTHDGTDIDHTTGTPECAVWGPSQIETYLAVDRGERSRWTAPYFANDSDSFPEPDTSVWLELGLEYIPEEDIPRLPDALRAIANAAVMDFYDMTDEQFALFERAARDLAAAPDGHQYFFLIYPGMDMCIHLLMDADTGEIVDITLMSGGNG